MLDASRRMQQACCPPARKENSQRGSKLGLCSTFLCLQRSQTPNPRRAGVHQYPPTPKSQGSWEGPSSGNPFPSGCRSGAAQGSSRGPVTFSIVASLVTSYTTQTTLACKREAAEGGERGSLWRTHRSGEAARTRGTALPEPQAGPTARQPQPHTLLSCLHRNPAAAVECTCTCTQPSDSNDSPAINTSSTTGCPGQRLAPLLRELL